MKKNKKNKKKKRGRKKRKRKKKKERKRKRNRRKCNIVVVVEEDVVSQSHGHSCTPGHILSRGSRRRRSPVRSHLPPSG